MLVLIGILIVIVALGVAGIIYSPSPRVPLSVWLAGQEWEWQEAREIEAEQAYLNRPETIMLAPQQLRDREVAA